VPDLSLTTSYVIKAPRRTVYDAWLDPAKLAAFIGHYIDLKVSDVSIEPRVDGRFAYRLGEDTYQGTYRALQPGETIRFSWELPQAKPGSYVSLTFRTVAEGCEVVLTHIHFPNSIIRDIQLERWNAVMRNLADLF
jgi:uncharacterized protein YndB with AHSA1/START domain